MFPILFNSIKTATRQSAWDAPEHWYRQQDDYHSASPHDEADSSRLRSALRRAGIY